MNATPRFLQLADVAEVLNISGAQVYALVRRHELKAIKIGGRGQWRVEASELEAYIQRAYADAEQFVRDHPFVEGSSTPGTDPTRAGPAHRASLQGRHGRVGDRLHDAGRAPSPTVSSKKSRPDPTDATLDLLVVAEVHQAGLVGRRQPAQHRAQRQPVDHRPGVLAVRLHREPADGGDALRGAPPTPRRRRPAAASPRPAAPAGRRRHDRRAAGPAGPGPARRAACEARLTREYSATVRSATSASRSARWSPSACCSRSSNTANIDSSQLMTLSMPRARASRKRSVDKRLTPDDSERCLMQTQANARIWGMSFGDLLVIGATLGPRARRRRGRSWSSRPPSSRSALVRTPRPHAGSAARLRPAVPCWPVSASCWPVAAPSCGAGVRRAGSARSTARHASGLGLPVPARPTGSAYAVPRQRVEVQPGDSLWRLARAAAPARPPRTQDVARLVARTYRANRTVIGPDPDLIRPGQRLRIPLQRQPPTPPTDDPRETP